MQPPVAQSAPPASARAVIAPPVAAAPPVAPGEPMPKLRLEVLVYSELPAERMVFINGRKYREGDMVADRARIETIQQDGVVLNEAGRRFTLRQ